MKTNPKESKLIYVNKIGYNRKDEGLYEFIFSDDPENIQAKEWGWTQSPAASNASPPSDDCVTKTLNLRTDLFELYCLHESNDRPYMHGYNTIHALAYEDEEAMENDTEYQKLYENSPLLVFHYGMTLEQVKDILYERDVVLKGDDFIATKPKAKVSKPTKQDDEEEKEESNDEFFKIKF
ncbi:MAG: hypothetical protein HC836_36410 [Richelia sp. RM2_1_2]|nr:hypothetical protein [Richelia sp. RM2_1_2]